MSARVLPSERYSAAFALRTASGAIPAHVSASFRVSAARSACETTRSNSPSCAGTAGARQDDHAHRVGSGEHAQRLDEIVATIRIEGVEFVRPIQCEGPDAPRDLDEYALVGSHQTRSTINAIPWPTPMHIVTKP